jgi:hypothetical protein
MARSDFDGSHWDTRRIRRIREFGWFRQNEARMIDEARQRRTAAEAKRRSNETEARRLRHWQKCPACGGDMRSQTIEGVGVHECRSCEGIFFDRDELEQVLLAHDAHRRGFFRRLLGFGNP